MSALTATVAPTLTGADLVLGDLDGESRRFAINRHWLALHPERDVFGEADRMLRRLAGYQVSGEWQPIGRGTYTVTLAELPNRCLTCVHGCACKRNSAGCGHLDCWAA